MRAFRAIGTDNLRIGKCPKVGSCSLDNMVYVGHPIYEYHEYDDNTKYVVLILKLVVVMVIFQFQ